MALANELDAELARGESGRPRANSLVTILRVAFQATLPLRSRYRIASPVASNLRRIWPISSDLRRPEARSLIWSYSTSTQNRRTVVMQIFITQPRSQTADRCCLKLAYLKGRLLSQQPFQFATVQDEIPRLSGDTGNYLFNGRGVRSMPLEWRCQPRPATNKRTRHSWPVTWASMR